jgi:hypothetical protein
MTMLDLKNVIAHALHNAFVTNKPTPLPGDDRQRSVPSGTICHVAHVMFVPSEAFDEPFDIYVALRFDADDTAHRHYEEWSFPLDFLVDDCEVLDSH